MSLNIVRFAHPHAETFIYLDKIAYVQRVESMVFVYFDGNPDPVMLRGEPAKVFLQVVKDSSLTIYASESATENDRGFSAIFQQDDTAAPEDETAQNQTMQGIGE
ncbi:MAG: hypothetical protein V7L14_08980 [Nostoc sp.]|uniref:hypothetical protein n=1 Tax=Nostoc sp. TaxID=1180 RepID=UPI002FFD45A4